MKYLSILLISLILVGCSSKQLSYDARLSGFEYPFEVKNYQFSSQRQVLEMSYMDLSGVESKKTVVLLHGKNFSGFYWKQIAQDLNAKGHRVIIPDQIGFGKSSKPRDYQFSFAQLALNTKNMLDELKVNNFILVGHSMGGMLAVTMANMFPNEIDKLVLINPIGLEKYLEYVEFKDPEFFYKGELNKSVEKVISYQKKNYYDGKWSPRYEELIVPTKGQLSGKDWPLVAWNNSLTYGPIFTEEVVSKFSNLKMKTYLILGTRDRTGPGRGWKKKGVKRELGRYDKLGREIKRLNKRKIKLFELKGLGHMPQFEDYKRFSEIFFPLF
ncbi:MAG: pimeloyl-ACP methyl ester carboxylesterase [Bacteriovoracaceae bacterium]|jgi:pimeloyl-ACP methyl ester carboxylesterase